VINRPRNIQAEMIPTNGAVTIASTRKMLAYVVKAVKQTRPLRVLFL